MSLSGKGGQRRVDQACCVAGTIKWRGAERWEVKWEGRQFLRTNFHTINLRLQNIYVELYTSFTISYFICSSIVHRKAVKELNALKAYHPGVYPVSEDENSKGSDKNSSRDNVIKRPQDYYNCYKLCLREIKAIYQILM